MVNKDYHNVSTFYANPFVRNQDHFVKLWIITLLVLLVDF